MFYGVSLWTHYNSSTVLKFKYCYYKCVQKCFGYNKYYSVTEILLDLRSPSFDAIIHNYRHSFSLTWNNHNNAMV